MKNISFIFLFFVFLGTIIRCKKWKLDEVPNLCTADFTITNDNCSAPCTLNFTNNSEGGESYLWDFGDGNTSSEQNPNHEYAEAGSYTITLTTKCDTTAAKTQSITIQGNANNDECSAVFSVTNSGCTAPCFIQFMPNQQEATSYTWNFGDGNTSTKQSPSHEYLVAGTYTVTLMLECNDSIFTSTKTIVIQDIPSEECSPPTFSITNNNCTAPCTVQFTTNQQEGTSYFWDFGDGNTSTNKNPAHTYEMAGTYNLTLMMECNGSTFTKTATINIASPENNPPPIAHFIFENGDCIWPCEITLINLSSYAEEFLWDFADGNTLESNTDTVTYSFPYAGGYNVTLHARQIATNKTHSVTYYIGIGSCGDLLKDVRDGKGYRTVQIGTQCWMAQNLNIGQYYDTQGSTEAPLMRDDGLIEKLCYEDDPNNCEMYGGLYEWNELMNYTLEEGGQGICPCGWHIPTDEEIKTLERNLGLPEADMENFDTWARGTNQGDALKADTLCYGGSSCGISEFNALLGGERGPVGSGYGWKNPNRAIFPTSVQTLFGSETRIWKRQLHRDKATVYRSKGKLDNARSVRCVQNVP